MRGKLLSAIVAVSMSATLAQAQELLPYGEQLSFQAAAELQSTVPETPVLRPDALPLENIPAQQAELPGMTLQELQFIALTNNPSLREASAKVAAAQGNAIQVGLPPNPGFFTSSPQWTGSVSQYNIVPYQDFVTGGKLRLNRQVALREVTQAQLQFTLTRYQVLTAVRTQFYATASAQRRSEVLNQLVEIAGRSRDVGQKLLNAGETNRADAMLLEIEHDKAIFAYRNNLATLAAARRQLAAVVGIADLDIGELQFDLTLPLPAYEHEMLRRDVVDRNALAAIASIEIERTRIALSRARAEPWPNFQLQGGFQYSVQNQATNPGDAQLHNQGYAQYSMSVPLWNRNQGGIRAANANIAGAAAASQRTRNQLSQQAALQLGTYLAADERVRIYQESILPKAREVFRINRSLFEQGQTDFLRLLQSQRTLIEADLGYIDAQEARWNAAAEIAGLLQLDQFP